MIYIFPGLFNDAINRFFDDSDFKHTTQRTYFCALKSFFEFLVKTCVTSPTKNDVKAWRDHMLATRKPKTAKTYLAVIKQFFRWAASEEIYKDIAYGIRKVA